MNPLAQGAPASTSSLVSVIGGQAKTTSLIVAEKFVKLHKNVLRAIDKLDCSEEFRRLNFEPSSYINEQGKPQPMCEMTKDGFTFLVTGFRGKEAAHWKEVYIAEFNRMEAALIQRQAEPAIPAPRKPAFSVEFSDGTAFHFGSVPCHE
ncbi:hypothetical protein CCP3SC15_4040004 [Gammaproteobacteria bacterium]